MNYFIFDTETTGLTDKDEVIQLAGFLIDDQFRFKQFVHFYCNTNVFIHKDAQNAHGIDNKMLYHLSKGRTLEDHLEDYDFLRNPKDIVFMGYNVKFDIGKVNGTLMNNGVMPIDFGRNVQAFPATSNGTNYNLCVMQTLTKMFGYKGWKKLQELVRLKLDKYSIKDLETKFDGFMKMCGCSDYFVKRYHNAAFDSFVTMLLVAEYRALYYV